MENNLENNERRFAEPVTEKRSVGDWIEFVSIIAEIIVVLFSVCLFLLAREEFVAGYVGILVLVGGSLFSLFGYGFGKIICLLNAIDEKLKWVSR